MMQDASSSRALGAATPKAVTKRKKHVLTEEEYVSGIEAIIERDFFPDIPLLKAKLTEFSRSEGKSQSQVGELFTVAAPFSSVRENSTKTEDGTPPLQVAPSGAQEASLDKFLSHFTSEDNASFGDLHEETLQRKRLKVQHLLTYPETQKIGGYIDWPFNPKNKLFYDVSVTGDVPYTETELAARVQGPPKEIRHQNTRLPVDFAPEAVPALKPGQDYHLPGVGVVDQAQRALLSTPMPIPGKNVTPIMTWGELAGTPIRLDRTPGFTIKAASERDVVARRMASSAKRSLQKRSARFTPSAVRTTPRTLSAAGKKLASALHRTPGTDLQLRASYAGTPRRSAGPKRAAPHPKIKKEPSPPTSGKITDDLLN